VLFDPAAELHVDPADRTAKYRVIDAVAASGISVRGARIVGNRVSPAVPTDGTGIRVLACDHVLIEHCTVANVPGTGIAVGHFWLRSSNVTVDGCVVFDNLGRGVHLIAASDVAVTNCTLRGHYVGIDLEPGAGQTNTSVTIQGNHVELNGVGVRLSEAYGTNDAVNLGANTIIANASHGIRGSARNLAAAANLVRQNGGDGIGITGGGAAVTGNIVSENTAAGIWIAANDSVVTANRTRANPAGNVLNTGQRNVVSNNVAS
jgi:parallel beta-helix repeat protein